VGPKASCPQVDGTYAQGTIDLGWDHHVRPGLAAPAARRARRLLRRGFGCDHARAPNMNERLGASRVAERAAVGVAAGAVVVVVWFTVRMLNRGHVAELVDAGVAVVVVVVGLVSVVATRHVLSDLRRLRLVIGLLSGASVVAVELTLYVLDMTGLINELVELLRPSSALARLASRSIRGRSWHARRQGWSSRCAGPEADARGD
jgi:hypothetical protein